MDTNKKQAAILYLEKHKGLLFVTPSEKPIIINFPDKVFRHGEIINHQEFSTLFQQLLSLEALSPSRLLIILDESVTYERFISDPSLTKEQEAIDDFLDIVPFEHPLSKVFHPKGRSHVVAINRDVIEEIITTFKRAEYAVIGVVPMSVIQKIIPNVKDNKTISLLQNRIDTIKQYTLLDFVEDEEKLITYAAPEIKSVRFILLVGTFTLLLMLLGFLLYKQFFVATPKVAPAAKYIAPTVVPSVIPTPTPEVSPTITEEQ